MARNRRNQLRYIKMIERKYRRQKAGLFALIFFLFAFIFIVIGFLFLIKNSDAMFFIRIRDKQAPVAVVRDVTVFNNQSFSLNDFLVSVTDDNNVNVNYVSLPDPTYIGTQSVSIEFTDVAGNKTIETAALTRVEDYEAPEITDDGEVYLSLGSAVSYKSLVSVTDNYDTEPELDIDNSQVDLSVAGDYIISYTATDKAGNSSYRDVVIHVFESDDAAELKRLADAECDYVINAIITEDMDTVHKIWAVYNYVRNIPYVLTDYTRDYVLEGYKILSNYQGDCYGSYSAVRLLLERLGIPVIAVQNDETTGSPHFWVMASPDDGVTWYHVDATNWVEWVYRPIMCLISDARLQEISEFHLNTHRPESYLYPATPAESYPVPDDIWSLYNPTERIY